MSTASFSLKPKIRLLCLCMLAVLVVGCQSAPPTPFVAVPPTAYVQPTLAAGGRISPTSSPDPNAQAYTYPNQAVEERVEALLSQMTIQEKIGQMTQVEKNSIAPADVTAYAIGSILSGGGGYPTGDNSIEGWAQMTDGFQEAALQTRLAIPMIYGVDAVHGHNNLYGATIFPHNVGLGAANDADLMKRIGRGHRPRDDGDRRPLGLRPRAGSRARHPLGPHLRRLRRKHPACYPSGQRLHRRSANARLKTLRLDADLYPGNAQALCGRRRHRMWAPPSTNHERQPGHARPGRHAR